MDTSAPPPVEPGDSIKIGNTPAVICTLHGPGDVEVVYIDARNHAISEDAVWEDGRWRFKAAGSSVGKYADKTPRLREYVEQLRQAQPKPSNVRPTRFR